VCVCVWFSRDKMYVGRFSRSAHTSYNKTIHAVSVEPNASLVDKKCIICIISRVHDDRDVLMLSVIRECNIFSLYDRDVGFRDNDVVERSIVTRAAKPRRPLFPVEKIAHGTSETENSRHGRVRRFHAKFNTPLYLFIPFSWLSGAPAHIYLDSISVVGIVVKTLRGRARRNRKKFVEKPASTVAANEFFFFSNRVSASLNSISLYVFCLFPSKQFPRRKQGAWGQKRRKITRAVA